MSQGQKDKPSPEKVNQLALEHMNGCEECRQEIIELASADRTVGLLGYGEPVTDNVLELLAWLNRQRYMY